MKILIDPGHGGPFPGAVSHGVRECDINLAVAKNVLPLLRRPGVEVWLTRDGDYALHENNRFSDISLRAKMAGEAGADLLVSLHCNNFTSESAHGMEVWTTVGENNSDAAAEYLSVELQVAFPHKRFRADLIDGDLDKEKNYNLIKEAPCPAVLVEMGFLSNDIERVWLQNEANQVQMAAAITRGILEWRVSLLG